MTSSHILKKRNLLPYFNCTISLIIEIILVRFHRKESSVQYESKVFVIILEEGNVNKFAFSFSPKYLCIVFTLCFYIHCMVFYLLPRFSTIDIFFFIIKVEMEWII